MHSYLFFNEIQSMKRLLNDYKLQNKSCNLKFLLLAFICHDDIMWPPTSNKRRFKSIFFEAFPAWICFKFTQLISTIPLCILCKYEANPCRESFEKKIDLNLLLFDVGGPSSLVMAGIQANFKLWPIFCSIYLIPILNLRPGLNSVAFFTYIVKFPAFKLVSFMAYTYNIQGW